MLVECLAQFVGDLALLLPLGLEERLRVSRVRFLPQVYVCEGSNHPALATRSVLTTEPSWIRGHAPPTITRGEPLSTMARIRSATAARMSSPPDI